VTTNNFILILFFTATTAFAQTTKPATIKVKKDDSNILKGQKIYIDNCASCHDNTKRGPKLNGVTDKYSKQWVLDFSENSERLIKLKDKDAVKIWLEWKKAPMTVFTGFTDETREQLYAYLKTLKK
jgi:cytochrome c2